MAAKKILVVDDEKMLTDMIKLNLDSSGDYEVLTLNSAKDILRQVHTFEPDVILLDLIMPDIGGIEVCEMLNKDPIGQKIPVIVLTAIEKDTDKLRAYKMGVVDYIVKPIDVDSIIRAIEKALSARKSD